MLSRVRLFATPWTVVHGILQARIRKWVAFVFSRDLPNPGIEPRSPTLQADSFPPEPQGKPKNTGVGSLSLLQSIFLNQELNWGLLHCRGILYQLSYLGRTSTIMLRTSGRCALVGHRLYILGKPAWSSGEMKPCGENSGGRCRGECSLSWGPWLTTENAPGNTAWAWGSGGVCLAETCHVQMVAHSHTCHTREAASGTATE